MVDQNGSQSELRDAAQALGDWFGKQGCALWGVIGVGALLFLSDCGGGDQASGPAPMVQSTPAEPLPVILADTVVAQCEALIAQGAKIGLVRARPSARRIDVDEVLWAQLPMATKRQLLQAVSCTAYRQSVPPGTESAVAYGWRDGQRKLMLSNAGFASGD